MNYNEWMSKFYNADWWEIDELDTDLNKKGMYEWRISPSNANKLSTASNFGFELVETMLEFETKVVPTQKEYPNIRFADTKDLEYIKKITRDTFLVSNKFYNRFKNEKYFTKEQANLYYESTVENYFFKDTCITVVVESKSKIIGYYMLNKVGENIYKGIMTGVVDEARGKGLHIDMQHFCFNFIGREITTINKTQLHNLSIINNHIKRNRKLARIEHVFYKFLK